MPADYRDSVNHTEEIDYDQVDIFSLNLILSLLAITLLVHSIEQVLLSQAFFIQFAITDQIDFFLLLILCV